MNKTPIIIIVVVIIIFLCCYSISALLWTLGVWQRANEPYRYEGSLSGTESVQYHIEEQIETWNETPVLFSTRGQ